MLKSREEGGAREGIGWLPGTDGWNTYIETTGMVIIALLAVGIPNTNPIQQCPIRYASRVAQDATTLEFVNATPLNVDVLWIDYEGAEQHYAGLGPFETYVQPTFATHPWIVRDGYSRQIIDYTFGKLQDQHIILSDEDIVPRESAAAAEW